MTYAIAVTPCARVGDLTTVAYFSNPNGLTEKNYDGHENDGPSKLHDMK